MAKIEIIKSDIVALDTDAVVNAANEGLWAGSGVCGAIFAAAGYEKLEAACDQIGHCDTGSAVITPGFDMATKYIIHAVGPVWEDGKHDEAKLLYGAYSRAMELAVEHGCGSIGFPLISSGVFGYPVDLAWNVAILACADFLKKGNEIDIVFAVRSDKIYDTGMKLLKNSGVMRMAKINKLIPHYDRRKRKWRVEFPDGNAEEGGLYYVACEYARTSLYFPYNTSQTKDKEWNGHAHSIDGVIHSLLEDPEGFTIGGFEECYSKQERDLLATLQNKLRMDKALTDPTYG